MSLRTVSIGLSKLNVWLFVSAGDKHPPPPCPPFSPPCNGTCQAKTTKTDHFLIGNKTKHERQNLFKKTVTATSELQLYACIYEKTSLITIQGGNKIERKEHKASMHVGATPGSCMLQALNGRHLLSQFCLTSVVFRKQVAEGLSRILNSPMPMPSDAVALLF